MRHSLMKLSPAFLGLAAILACGSDSTSPSAGTAAGGYSAFEFVTTGSSGQTNQLLIGSTMQINLAANGTMTGHLHLAASGSQPAFDADMAGTWSQTGNVVDFTQAADTFVRDMLFTIQPIATGVWDLLGDGSFSGTAVHLTLRHGA